MIKAELKAIGCWGAFPAAGGACSGYVVQNGLSSVLIDCGHGVVGKLLESVPLNSLEAVMLSHLHPDHWHDLPALRHALRHSTAAAGPLPLWTTNKSPEAFAMIASYVDAFSVHAVENDRLTRPFTTRCGVTGVEISMGLWRARFFPAKHAVPAYCIELLWDGKRFFYTGDTTWWDGLEELTSGADLLLAEASLYSSDRHLNPNDHLTAAEAGKLAQKSGAGMLILTHFQPGCDLERLRREAQGEFQGKVLLAQEGMSYQF